MCIAVMTAVTSRHMEFLLDIKPEKYNNNFITEIINKNIENISTIY